MDSILIWTIFMIFVAALAGMVVRYRTLDKCLKGMDGFFVTIEWVNGRRAWGELGVYHNAIELIFHTPHHSAFGAPVKTSYIIYKAQFKDIYCIKRQHDELSEANQEDREKEIRRTYRPNLFRRTLRRLRNLFNLLRDALGQAFGAFVGQAKKTSESTLLQTQDARLTDTATKLLTAVPAAYEPILENYIGHRVVLEIERNGAIQEVCGILKEYTGEFVCILDTPLVEDYTYELHDTALLDVNRNLDFTVEPSGEHGLDVAITNRGDIDVEVERAEGQDYQQTIGTTIAPGESARFALVDVPAPAEPATIPAVTLVIRTCRITDLVVPRSRGVIRHGSEKITPGRIKML